MGLKIAVNLELDKILEMTHRTQKQIKPEIMVLSSVEISGYRQSRFCTILKFREPSFDKYRKYRIPEVLSNIEISELKYDSRLQLDLKVSLSFAVLKL